MRSRAVVSTTLHARPARVCSQSPGRYRNDTKCRCSRGCINAGRNAGETFLWEVHTPRPTAAKYDTLLTSGSQPTPLRLSETNLDAHGPCTPPYDTSGKHWITSILHCLRSELTMMSAATPAVLVSTNDNKTSTGFHHTDGT